MSVVHYLGNVIASCTHLASMLESGTVQGEPQDEISGKMLVIPNVSCPILLMAVTDRQSEEVVYAEAAIDASIVICIALATKNHLLAIWGLSEE
jgi:cohesin loading factor subunit SCC2